MFNDGTTIETKLKGGNYYVDTKIDIIDGQMFFKFPYNKKLIEEIKARFERRKWHGFDEENPRKIWSAPITQRNIFQLRYLQGKYADINPYDKFDKDISLVRDEVIKYCKITNRPVYSHQVDMICAALTTHEFYWACEMGTGKTLAAFIVMEMSGIKEWFWLGPKSALRQTYYELHKWNCAISPTFYTYEGLKSVIENWPEDFPAPEGLICDEGVKVKTPTAQRSVAVKHLADSMREDHSDVYIGLLSGSPAPKSPADWYWQTEIVCPGFLRERNIHDFKHRLSLVEEREKFAGGGAYPHLITWWNDSKKCKICGETKDHAKHQSFSMEEETHTFEPSQNEVANLYKRMKGLVTVKFKKDCLDLPEIVYDVITVPPTMEILQAAKIIAAKGDSVIKTLIALRELSDGFQYVQENKGARQVIEVPCPKDDVIIEQLDLHFDIGRLNIYAGFTASIDRIIKICHKLRWNTLRVDGRGWLGQTFNGDILPDKKLLELYDSGNDRYVFVGQPGAAGMGLDLSASPTTLFYSNDYNASSRIQAEARGHRIGMSEHGGRIIDIIHLPSDKYVLDNLQAKRDLQHLTLTGIQQSLE